MDPKIKRIILAALSSSDDISGLGFKSNKNLVSATGRGFYKKGYLCAKPDGFNPSLWDYVCASEDFCLVLAQLNKIKLGAKND